MNGTDELDEEQTTTTDEEQPQVEQTMVLGQDQEPIRTPIAAPQSPLIMRGPVSAPGSAPVASPIQPLTDQQAKQRAEWRRLQHAVADVPYKEAADAVAAALKFQGMRGYQEDLARGVPAAEALAKWAPTMFAPAKNASMSGAASMIRATRPPADRIMDVGGQAFRYDQATRAMQPLTQPKVVAPKNDAFALQEHSSLLGEIRRTETKLDQEVDLEGPTAKALQEKLQYLKAEAQKVRDRARATPRPQSSTATGRIRVKSPDGKTGSIPASQLDAALAAGYTKM